MTSTHEKTTRAAYLIADHLDRILAAGEDLLKLKHVTHRPNEADEDHPASCSINRFVHDCRELELTAAAAILRAHEHSAALGESDESFAPLARLFKAGTGAILDIVDTLADREGLQFSGDDPLAFLRARGLIDHDAGCLLTVEGITVGEDYLIAGVIELGPLMDMAATFLDALELHFDLFPEIEEAAPLLAAGALPEPTAPRL